ncbi:MAG: ParB/RepB/Spo0J family partition protein [Defluviitaleaceae bacterium]|nr:ParB/RepB/Spo0J family partition protein [Defluviitaleaceae bacterium]
MSNKKILGDNALSGFDNIFKSTTKKAEGENIVHIPLDELHPPDIHPFHVIDDAAMTRLVNNIKQYGVREPGIARPRPNGGYELLCGNRRKFACERAEIPTLPVIVRELDDDSAILAMIDSNLEQREKLLPSEKAHAYRMKMETLNHSGVKAEMHSVDILVAQTGESKNQIFRLIRLTELVVALLDKVDTKQIAFNPAVELSYLSQSEQTAVAAAMEKYDVKPSLSQAVQLKKLKQSGELTAEMIDTILAEKKSQKDESDRASKYKGYFPKGYSLMQMDEIITGLLCDWQIRTFAGVVPS